MQQQAAYGGNRRGVDRPRKMTLLRGEALFRIAKKNPQKYRATERSEQTHFGEQLHVVVVHMVDDQPVVENFESRVYGHERTQSTSGHRVSEEDLRCAAH